MPLPAVPDTFSWTQQPWGAALTCRPLEAIAPHLFTTRQLALSSAGDWCRLAEAFGVSTVVTLTQVHGRNVAVLREGEPPPAQRPEADVLVSNHADASVAVRAADCVPLLVADPRSGAVAAAHAGWRGTAAGTATAAVEALAREFGAKPHDLVVAIGPSIGACCYEVGSDLVDAFAAAGHARHLIDRWFAAPPPRRGSRERPALRLDLWAANRDQLVLAGLDEQNVHVCGLCTASHVELFPSFRMEKERTGRLAGIIRAGRAG